jgi:hypothetical protein
MRAIGELLLLLFFNLRCRDKIIELSQNLLSGGEMAPLLAEPSLLQDAIQFPLAQNSHSLWLKTTSFDWAAIIGK